MSLPYRRIARAPLRTSFPAIRLSRPATSSLSTSSYRAALNESDRGHESVAEDTEKHKQDQLQDQKEGRNKWKKELGSNSEQAIKADRGEVDASDDVIKKMQHETAQAAEAGKK